MLYDTRNSAVLPAPVAVDPRPLVADDGRELRATWFWPAGGLRGGVVVVPAMAVPASYYAEFATWLAAQGFLTLTFDYRGMGSPAEMRAERGDVLRWAGDAASALEALDAEVRATAGGPLPLTWVGHSLGGQVLPFARHDLLDQAVFVASGSGYWRHNVAAVRRWAPLLWRVIAPVAIRAVGYYPGSRIGLLQDLPPNVMRQWARWCLSPDYYGVDVPHLQDRVDEVTLPIASLSFADDELLSRASIEALNRLFRRAALTHEHHAPADRDVTRIGHHGFFRPRHRPLWQELVRPRLAEV